MKKVLSVLLALVMLFGVSIPALAYSVDLSAYPAALEAMVAVPGLEKSYQFDVVPNLATYDKHWVNFYPLLQDSSRISYLYFHNKNAKFYFVSLPSDVTFTKGIGSTGLPYYSFRSSSSDISFVILEKSSNGFIATGANMGHSSELLYNYHVIIPYSNNYAFDADLAVMDVNQIFASDWDHPLVIPESKTLTVNYVYPNGSQAAEPVVQSVEAGAAYSIASPSILGYTPNLSTVSGTMPGEDLAVTVSYVRNVHSLNINYLHEDQTQAAPGISVATPYGVTFSHFSPEIAGYHPSIAQVTGNMPDHDLSIDVVYSATLYTLTIQYLYEDGSQAAESVSQSLVRSSPYSVLSPKIDGYSPDKAVVKGNMPGWNLLETVTYSALSSSGGDSSSSGSGSGGDDDPSSSGGSSTPSYEFSNPFDRSDFEMPSFSNPFDRSDSSTPSFSNPFDRNNFEMPSFSNPFDRSGSSSPSFSNPFDRSNFEMPYTFSSFSDWFDRLIGG